MTRSSKLEPTLLTQGYPENYIRKLDELHLKAVSCQDSHSSPSLPSEGGLTDESSTETYETKLQAAASEIQRQKKLAPMAEGRRSMAEGKLSREKEQYDQNVKVWKSSKHRETVRAPGFYLAETRQELRRAYAEILQTQDVVADQEKQIEILRTKINKLGDQDQTSLIRSQRTIAHMTERLKEQAENSEQKDIELNDLVKRLDESWDAMAEQMRMMSVKDDENASLRAGIEELESAIGSAEKVRKRPPTV